VISKGMIIIIIYDLINSLTTLCLKLRRSLYLFFLIEESYLLIYYKRIF
jgi:hypothetical protein